jgi:hypothetical protein
MRKAGLGGSFAVENVGAGYHTLADAFSGWRDSPPHRANMLNRSPDVTGNGISKLAFTILRACPSVVVTENARPGLEITRHFKKYSSKFQRLNELL